MLKTVLAAADALGVVPRSVQPDVLPVCPTCEPLRPYISNEVVPEANMLVDKPVTVSALVACTSNMSTLWPLFAGPGATTACAQTAVLSVQAAAIKAKRAIQRVMGGLSRRRWAEAVRKGAAKWRPSHTIVR